jgi:hypothetical protein
MCAKGKESKRKNEPRVTSAHDATPSKANCPTKGPHATTHAPRSDCTHNHRATRLRSAADHAWRPIRTCMHPSRSHPRQRTEHAQRRGSPEQAASQQPVGSAERAATYPSGHSSAHGPDHAQASSRAKRNAAPSSTHSNSLLHARSSPQTRGFRPQSCPLDTVSANASTHRSTPVQRHAKRKLATGTLVVAGCPNGRGGGTQPRDFPACSQEPCQWRPFWRSRLMLSWEQRCAPGDGAGAWRVGVWRHGR